MKYVNFEDIFHVVELLHGYSLNSSVKRNTSAYKVFTRFKKKFSSIDRLSITSSARKIFGVINDIVAEYSAQFKKKSGYFYNFLQALENDYVLNIFNLNYDTWCEQSLKSYDDGFRSVSGYKTFQRFSIEKYRQNIGQSKNTEAHLHGSILFADADLKRNDSNRFAYEDDRNSLYKYVDYEAAKACRDRLFKSSSNNQAGEP